MRLSLFRYIGRSATRGTVSSATCNRGRSLSASIQCEKFKYEHKTSTMRYFSSPPSVEKKDETEDKDNEATDTEAVVQTHDGIDSSTRDLMQLRHKGINMNTNGISQQVLPGGYIVKTDKKTGEKRMVGLERNMGYFWELKDLRETGEKPILSNDELIPIDDAQVFPALHGNLQNLEDEDVSLPQYITKDNRAKDPAAECTLVVACFNEFGNQMLPSWTEPFEKVFLKDSNRIKMVWLSMNEGRILGFLSSMIKKSSKKNIPDYRKKNYLMYFGECPEFRDVIRMHNMKTGYAFLLDGLGRVRFAGSGRATDDEMKKLIAFTKKLAPGLKADDTNVDVKR